MNGVSVTVFSANVTCADKRDGYIKVELGPYPAGTTVEYYWTPDTLCPMHDCNRIDSLSAGTFTVETKLTFPGGRKESYTSIVIISDKNGICNLKVYTGISLSGGNPKFTIDNIELYPEARVSIYNRWGVKLFDRDKYNTVDNYWPLKGEKVVPGTYLYHY